MCVGETGNTFTILCTGQATKNMLVDGSAEPCYQMGHIKYETKRNTFRHIQTKECVFICETRELAERQLCAQAETKWLVVRLVMQWANCAPARPLKLFEWIALLSLLWCTRIEKWQIIMEKEHV